MPTPYELPTRWLEWHDQILVIDPASTGMVYDLREFLWHVPIEILREVLAEREKSIPQVPETG